MSYPGQFCFSRPPRLYESFDSSTTTSSRPHRSSHCIGDSTSSLPSFPHHRHLHKADSLFAKATEEIRRQKTLLTLVRVELDDVNDFLDNHRDSVEDRAPGILSEFQRIRERQGILEENQEFEHADIQRRLTQFSQRISDLRSICLRIDAELSRGTDSDDNRTL